MNTYKLAICFQEVILLSSLKNQFTQIKKATVKQDISADTLFSRLGDFAVPRILIFADAGTEHSSFIVLLSHISYFFSIICKSRRQFLFLAMNILLAQGYIYCTTRVKQSQCSILENRENNMSAEISCFTVWHHQFVPVVFKIIFIII